MASTTWLVGHLPPWTSQPVAPFSEHLLPLLSAAAALDCLEVSKFAPATTHASHSAPHTKSPAEPQHLAMFVFAV